MELIRPAEISGKIMTLIESAKEKVVIISPYNKIRSWTKLTKRIREAKKKGVNLDWYIRKNIDGNYREVAALGITPIEIESLHCKIYLNEKSAIVTSMNLHHFSDTNSIDIGYSTTTENEYSEIVEFIELYISKSASAKVIIPSEKKLINHESFNNLLLTFLQQHFLLKNHELVPNQNKYGQIITVVKFKRNYRLIFEPRAGYFRIDLRIDIDWKKRAEVYENLQTKKEYLTQEIGHRIEFGSQMKRIKIDIGTTDQNSNKLTRNDFIYMEETFNKVITTYSEILE